MTGYVSGFALAEESPPGWAIVDVAGDPDGARWRATLPIHTLVELLASGRPRLSLRVPHERDGDDLLLFLGPARIRAPIANWQALVDRLTSLAGNASDLLEAPGTRPWNSGIHDVAISDVMVVDARPPK